MHNAFSAVKAALASHADKILADYNVKHNKEGTKTLSGEWSAGWHCPLCADRSGSASFTQQLYLKCHQCGFKGDVFDWLGKYTRKSAWDLCQELAKTIGVDLPKSKRPAKSAKGMPSMSEELLAACIEDLWRSPDAELLRKVLIDRKLTDQQLCADMGIGFLRGWIIFTSRDENGTLLQKYRGWNPAGPTKWMWFGQGTGGVGIWPTIPAPAKTKILLLEGESDVMTAWMRLRLHEQGWHPCTWTAGASSCPQPQNVPTWMQKREIHIGYDNDVFQGDKYGEYHIFVKEGSSIEKVRSGVEQRLRNLLQKLCPLLENLGAYVVVRKCPVDPKVKWGGDFRDWVDDGGYDLNDWQAFPFEQLPSFDSDIRDVSFGEVHEHVHRKVRTHVQVYAIARDDVLMATQFEMKCEMGMHPACAKCPGARLFPDKTIDMSLYPRELAVGLEEQRVADKIIRDVVQRPKNCPHIEVVPLSSHRASEWQCMAAGKMVESQITLHVFSGDQPSLSGEMEIEGTPYPNGRSNGVVFLASSVKQLDKANIDLGSHAQDFITRLPCFSDRLEDIDEALERRTADLSYNVTKVYGRRDIHITHDLMMHSARRAKVFGATQRAWLDVCVYGDTRTGKSLTFRRMMDFHGLGIYNTAVSNVSRAGYLMGAGRNNMLVPGMFPRNTRKAVMIDELHFLVQNSTAEHPMSWLQSVRDSGVASGVKIYGDRDLPAEVRLACLANWMHNKRARYQFACEHLLALYGAPETLARLDFGLAVEGRPTDDRLQREEQWWSKDRTRTLIMRAWALEAEQVVIDPEAEEVATSHCKMWEGKYNSEYLPLFTPEEKASSIMRIAIAVANLMFSHPRGNPYSVHVRAVHAEWAALWLEKVWQGSGYDLFSLRRQESSKILKPFEVEKALVLRLGLEDAMVAASGLSSFLTPFTASEIGSLTGLDAVQATSWLNRMVALHLFERHRTNNGYNVQFQLTQGGSSFIHNMIRLAETDEQHWFERVQAMRRWSSGDEPSGLTPMTADAWEIEDDRKQDVPF